MPEDELPKAERTGARPEAERWQAGPWVPWRRGNRAAFLSYLVLSLFFTWPLIGDLNSSVPTELFWDVRPGNDRFSDHFQFMWNGWWLKESLCCLTNPYFCQAVYHPFGANLALHTTAYGAMLPMVPLLLAMPLVPAYNITLLLVLAFCGYNAFWAARGLVGGFWPSWTAGFVFAFNPFHMGKGLAHLNIFAYLWVPVFVLMLLRAADRPERHGRWVGLGLLLALNFYTGFYNFMDCFWFLAFFLAMGPLLLGAPLYRWQHLKGLALAAGVSVLAALPLAGQIAQLKLWGPDVLSQGTLHPMPWRMLFTRPLLHPWFSLAAVREVAANWTYYWHHYLGWPLVLFSLGAWLRRGRRREVAFWTAAGLFFLVLMLNVEYKCTEIFRNIPMMENFRGFDEFLGVIIFICGLLTAHALAAVWRFGRRLYSNTGSRLSAWSGPAATALVLAMLAFEFWCLPYPVAKMHMPEFFQAVAEDPRDVALLDLPLCTGQDWVGPDHGLYFQTQHEKPRLITTLSRIPQNLQFPYAGFEQLTRLRRGRSVDPEALGRELDKLGIGWVAVEREHWPHWQKLERLVNVGGLPWREVGRDQRYTLYRREVSDG